MNCKVFIMVKGQRPCSQLCGWWEQSCRSKPEAANARAVVFRELDSASLNENESGQPFRRGEASIGPEALTKRRGWTLRGERRQRAQTEPTGTWEARHCRSAARQKQPMGRRHNFQRCGAVASDIRAKPCATSMPMCCVVWRSTSSDEVNAAGKHPVKKATTTILPGWACLHCECS